MLTAFYCTARKEPRFDWLADSYVRNLNANPNVACELIVVDKLLWGFDADTAIRREQLADAVNGRFSYRHVPPKPNAWQGPYRKTKRDFYALTSARNTAVALARGQHVIEIDDCTVLGDQWLYWHAKGADRRIVVCGGFVSWNKAVVENGKVISGEQHPNQDTRGEQMRKGFGGWMYGLNFSAPVDALLKVNGFDQLYDGQGGSEDVDCGVRLERAGCYMAFIPGCEIHQILESHDAVCEHEGWGRPQPKPQKERVLKADGIPHFANEFLIQELFEEPGRILSRGNEFNLAEMRKRALVEGYSAFPTTFAVETDWRDGERLEVME
jgi:hypothetical protein